MGATLTVTLDAPEVQAAFRRWQRLGRDPQPMMRAIGVKLAANTRDRFDQGHDPEGRPWAALSPAYAGLKRGAGILRESGMRGGLQGSITFDAGRDEVSIGSNKVYAAIHQFGGVITAKRGPYLIFRTANGFAQVRSVTIPARPYLGISAEDRDDVLDVIEAFYVRGR